MSGQAPKKAKKPKGGQNPPTWLRPTDHIAPGVEPKWTLAVFRVRISAPEISI